MLGRRANGGGSKAEIRGDRRYKGRKRKDEWIQTREDREKEAGETWRGNSTEVCREYRSIEKGKAERRKRRREHNRKEAVAPGSNNRSELGGTVLKITRKQKKKPA